MARPRKLRPYLAPSLPQARLVKIASRIVEGMTPEQAVKEEKTTATTNEVLLDPGFPLAMLRAVSSVATGDMLPKALRTLSALLEDNDSRVRLAAANSIVRMCSTNGNLVNLENANTTAGADSLETLSTDELAALIERLESTKAARAVDVTNPDAETSNPLFQFG